MTALFNIPNLILAIVVARPSKTIKSPYVADIKIIDDKYHNISSMDDTYLCHTPSLGCSGLVDKNQKIMVIENNNKKAKTKYVCYLGLYEEISRSLNVLVGVFPTHAEKIVKKCLLTDKLSMIKINKDKLSSQYTIDESRFDFHGFTEDNIEFILEVKAVPIAKYVDGYENKKTKIDINNYSFNNKIALFPIGFQKKKYEIVSERALKHLKHLESIKLKNNNIRTIIAYVIQRDDASSFQASETDPIYKKTLSEVKKNGVEIFTILVKWTDKGDCIFVNDNITINL